MKRREAEFRGSTMWWAGSAAPQSSAELGTAGQAMGPDLLWAGSRAHEGEGSCCCSGNPCGFGWWW